MKNSISIFSSTVIATMLFLNLNVMAQTPFIDLIQPTEPGIEWTLGGSYLISWTDNFQSTTDILLSSDGGATYPTVLETGLTGSTWTWNTTGLSVGNNYKIKVQSTVSPGSYFDFSANKFALVDEAAGTITLNQPTGNEFLAQGVSYLISWNDNLTVPVKVELLENNVLKSTISASTTGTTLSWTVPSTGITPDSKIYKIKISSTVAGSTTTPAISGRFTITSSSGTYVEVLQPNGGEDWAVGTSHLISWNDDFAEAVNIELFESGVYTEIASGVTGSTYVWNIPSNESTSTNCKVRISSSVDASIKDKSDSRFALTASSGSFIEVLQPNGGEDWARGTNHLISWNDDLTETVNIKLYKWGTFITDIASDVSGSTYSWDISSSINAGSGYKVKIISSVDDNLKDYSDARFTLTESAGTFIEVLQPNGGESWARGTNHLISWNDDLTETVNIKLYKSNSFVTDIASDVSGSTYSWDISSGIAAGSGYKVKIISTLDDDIKDYSDAGFYITASAGTYVEVLQPNGGESWAVGTTHLISWIDDLPENVDIKLVQSGFETEIASDVSGSTYSWSIPSTHATGTNFRVKIYSTLDDDINDRSDANFEIAASTGTFIEVLQPNGGETWARGNSYLISWNDDLFEDVDIKLYKGGSFSADIADDVSGSSYTWNIPSGQIVGTNYKIKIVSSLDPTVKDYSDANFEISASAGTYITIQQPNGGESWVRGNDYLISWTDDFTEDVDIKLVKGGVVTEIASGVSGSSYTWSIPTGQLVGSNYKVKIISTLDAGLYDLSNSNFSILASSGTFVTVAQPNGGESWIRGGSYLISWSDDFPEDVNIELFKGGQYNADIATGVSGSTYTWNIPSGQTAASNYKVKIYSTSDATIKDFSNANFSIVVSSMMSVYPNPANQNITLNMENSDNGIFQVVIYDRFNKAVMETSFDTQFSNEIEMQTSQLANGVYFVTATSGDYRTSKKIIIQH